MTAQQQYAHQWYPNADEGETRPLAAETPHLYARALGLDVDGTDWIQAPANERMLRIGLLEAARRTALLADALTQGMTGDEAWQWADTRAAEESGEWIFERAQVYGVNPDMIRPYPCGPQITRETQ